MEKMEFYRLIQRMVDFHEGFKRLKNIGYDRFITIEREISGPQQLKDILNAKKYFEKVLSEI